MRTKPRIGASLDPGSTVGDVALLREQTVHLADASAACRRPDVVSRCKPSAAKPQPLSDMSDAASKGGRADIIEAAVETAAPDIKSAETGTVASG